MAVVFCYILIRTKILKSFS